MKALSIMQPWAWLIVHGHKDIENRTWPTRFRGPVLIHAGKRLDKIGLAIVRHAFTEIRLPESFDQGGIVGQANITGCVEESDSPWFKGEYGFTLADARPLPFRPCKGQLGFFDVDLDRLPDGVQPKRGLI